MMVVIMILYDSASGESDGRCAHYASHVESTTQLEFVYHIGNIFFMAVCVFDWVALICKQHEASAIHVALSSFCAVIIKAMHFLKERYCCC